MADWEDKKERTPNPSTRPPGQSPQGEGGPRLVYDSIITASHSFCNMERMPGMDDAWAGTGPPTWNKDSGPSQPEIHFVIPGRGGGHKTSKVFGKLFLAKFGPIKAGRKCFQSDDPPHSNNLHTPGKYVSIWGRGKIIGIACDGDKITQATYFSFFGDT